MNARKRSGLMPLGWTVFSLGLIATFNFVIDPYKLLHTTDIEGLNVKKTRIFYQLAVTKPHDFYASDRASLILGSSRAGRAIDPAHPSLANDNFYNFATPGSRPRQDYEKLRAALATRSIKKVIYSVDFYSFNSFDGLPGNFVEQFRKRMARNGSVWTSPEFVQQSLLDYGANFWSYHTLQSSIGTIQEQAAASSGELAYTSLQDDGLWVLHSVKNQNILEGFAAMELTYLQATWFSTDVPRFSLNATDATVDQPFEDFRKLLILAHENNIEMTIIILPEHARLLETLAEAGLWGHFEYWKKQLVKINEETALSRNVPPFKLWDFDGYYPVATESVSDAANAQPPQWVYDSAHVHVRTGNRILDIIAGRTSADFGGEIDSRNIENWLKTQRDLRASFRSANPELVKQLKNRVEKIRARRPWTISPLPKTEQDT